MGWNMPSQQFMSRPTYKWNNVRTKWGMFKANMHSPARVMEIRESHIAPIWSTIARYVIDGSVPDSRLPLPPAVEP